MSRTAPIVVSFVLLATIPSFSPADTVTCGGLDQHAEARAALLQISAAVDPCGQSAEVARLMARLRSCTTRYDICRDSNAASNSYDLPIGEGTRSLPRTLIWNPSLQDELESSCEGDPTQSVRRDPTASLLHELVHVVQDCEGLNPTEHEIEAVRIENIYRRSRGLCQRTRYGGIAIPQSMTVQCSPTLCSCTPHGPADIAAR